MLRYGFLPSDFHPQFLILGERGDIAGLAQTLRRFADAPHAIEIEHRAPDDASRDTRLRIVPADASTGLQHGSVADEFVWTLDRRGAEAFADMVEAMLAEPEPAGSTILEVAGASNIPVKVSHGEFTDDFLIAAF
ncbi:hypothetical protein [uncultured Sphingomonas sp.]|uniref:hypothetical protein n=1 Tax=uncultured Sphingomonas sp. TaxID=158754 RepID=UPI0025F9FE99|nr:hypothetical protein [uncultured Sphingomonas sp.]